MAKKNFGIVSLHRRANSDGSRVRNYRIPSLLRIRQVLPRNDPTTPNPLNLKRRRTQLNWQATLRPCRLRMKQATKSKEKSSGRTNKKFSLKSNNKSKKSKRMFNAKWWQMEFQSKQPTRKHPMLNPSPLGKTAHYQRTQLATSSLRQHIKQIPCVNGTPCKPTTIQNCEWVLWAASLD